MNTIRFIGFTFSFPCKQEGLASARLTAWTKGFSCAGVVNEDVVKLLQEAIMEKVIQSITSFLSIFHLLITGYQC
jgi:hexokinase